MSIDEERKRILAANSLLMPFEKIASKFFYYEANRFVCWLGAISEMSPVAVGAIVAALSPRNGWHTNQLDAISICQGGDRGFNVVGRDLGRARELLALRPETETEALRVLSGPKTSAFFRNLIHPSSDVGIPIDRHIARIIYGHDLSESKFTSLLSRSGEYDRLERVISRVAKDLGLRPIVLANRLWYVQRRLNGNRNQHPLFEVDLPWRPIYPGGEYRLSLHPRLYPKLTILPGCNYRPWLLELPFPSGRFGNETRDSRGRIIVNLTSSHPYANQNGGWQYRSRLVASYMLDRTLRKDEHVHHERDSEQPEDLTVLAVQLHGKLHASANVLAGYHNGRFIAQPDDRTFSCPRFKAITGPTATKIRSTFKGEI